MRRWDRKQVGFFLLLAAFVLLSVSAITAVADPGKGGHEILDEEHVYRSSLFMFFKSGGKPDGSALTARSRSKLQQLAAVIPGERRTAHLFFPGGRDPRAVEEFLGTRKVDLYVFTARATTPRGSELVPLSENLVGTRSGSVSARVESAMRAGLKESWNRTRGIPENAPFTVIEIGVIGSIAELRKLADSRGEFVFSFRPSARMATAFDSRYRCYQEHGASDCETHITGIPAGAQPEEMGKAARQALSSFLKTEDPVVIAKKLVDARQELEDGARRAPRQRRAAQVFLKYPVDGREVELLLWPRALELVQMETTVADAGSPGQFVTRQLGPKQLEMGDSIEERIDTAWGRERVTSRNAAVKGSNNNVVIRVEVEGTRESLQMLPLSPLVQGVFVDENKVVAQRPDALDPRPERGMKRLVIPGGPVIPEIFPMPRASISQADDLRKLAREHPKERRIAVLLLRRDLSIEDTARLLDDMHVKFLNHRPALIVAAGAPPVTLAPEILVRQTGSPAQQLRGAAVEAGAIEGNQNVRVLRLGVEGEAANLVRLLEDERVFAVMLDSVEL